MTDILTVSQEEKYKHFEDITKVFDAILEFGEKIKHNSICLDDFTRLIKYQDEKYLKNINKI